MSSFDVIKKSLFVFETDPTESTFEWSLVSYSRHFEYVFFLFQLIIKSLDGEMRFKKSSFYIIESLDVNLADVTFFQESVSYLSKIVVM